MTIKLQQTITRTVIDVPHQADDRGRTIQAAVTHEETTPRSPGDRGAGGVVQTHVTVDGPINAEFSQEEATEVVKALVLSANLNRNDSGRRRRVERTLLRMGLDPADLAVFDD